MIKRSVALMVPFIEAMLIIYTTAEGEAQSKNGSIPGSFDTVSFSAIKFHLTSSPPCLPKRQRRQVPPLLRPFYSIQ